MYIYVTCVFSYLYVHPDEGHITGRNIGSHNIKEKHHAGFCVLYFFLFYIIIYIGKLGKLEHLSAKVNNARTTNTMLVIFIIYCLEQNKQTNKSAKQSNISKS